MSPHTFFLFHPQRKSCTCAFLPHHLYNQLLESAPSHNVHSEDIGGDGVFREGSHQHTRDLFCNKSFNNLDWPYSWFVASGPFVFLSIWSTICVNFLQTYCAAPKHSAKKTNSSHLIWKKFSPIAIPPILYIWCGFLFVQKTLESPPPPM